MSDQPELPQGDIPEDCISLMKQLHQAIATGNFDKCMELQQLTNKSLRENGQPAYEFPIEYFHLFHQMFDPSTMKDQEKMKKLSTRLMAFQREAGIDFSPSGQSPVEIDFPEEYQVLQKQAAEAFERKDWPEFDRLVKESEAVMNRSGIFTMQSVIMDPETENYPNLYSLTYLAIEINGALEANPDMRLTFEEVYKGLEKKKLLKKMDKRFSKLLSFRILLDNPDELEATYETLGMVADYMKGREERKMGIKKSGVHLVLALVIEAIQQQYWVPPNR